MADEPKTISRDTYLKALGLFTLANYHRLKCEEFSEALKLQLGIGEDWGAFTHITEEIWETKPNFDKALERSGYVVEPQTEGP